MTTNNEAWQESDFYNKVCNKTNTIINVSILHNKINYSMDKYDKFPDRAY